MQKICHIILSRYLCLNLYLLLFLLVHWKFKKNRPVLFIYLSPLWVCTGEKLPLFNHPFAFVHVFGPYMLSAAGHPRIRVKCVQLHTLLVLKCYICAYVSASVYCTSNNEEKHWTHQLSSCQLGKSSLLKLNFNRTLGRNGKEHFTSFPGSNTCLVKLQWGNEEW